MPILAPEPTYTPHPEAGLTLVEVLVVLVLLAGMTAMINVRMSAQPNSVMLNALTTELRRMRAEAMVAGLDWVLPRPDLETLLHQTLPYDVDLHVSSALVLHSDGTAEPNQIAVLRHGALMGSVLISATGRVNVAR